MSINYLVPPLEWLQTPLPPARSLRGTVSNSKAATECVVLMFSLLSQTDTYYGIILKTEGIAQENNLQNQKINFWGYIECLQMKREL